MKTRDVEVAAKVISTGLPAAFRTATSFNRSMGKIAKHVGKADMTGQSMRSYWDARLIEVLKLRRGQWLNDR